MKLFNMIGAMTMAVGFLVGCSAKYSKETDNVDATAAYQLLDREQFEVLDLPKLIVSTAQAMHNPGVNDSTCSRLTLEESTSSQCKSSSRIDSDSNAANNISPKKYNMEEAFSYFQCVTKDMLARSSDEIKVRNARNSIQERILAASTQRCNAFETNLQRTSSRHNFYSGLLSTAAGTVGGLVTAADGARIFSGVSGVASGYRAEFNQDYMANLATHVITEGIDKRRREVYAQIQTRGQGKSMSEYPLEAAVKDALYYHGQCSVIVGFQEAADAIKYVVDPGMDASIRALSKINLAKQLTANPSTKTSAEVMTELEEINKKGFIGPRNMAGTSLSIGNRDEGWTQGLARKNAEDGYQGIVKKKEAFKNAVETWKTELKDETLPTPAITGFEDMEAAYNKALDKISANYREEQAGKIQCKDIWLNDQCSTTYRLSELTQLIADNFLTLIDNHLDELKKKFDAIPKEDGKPRNEAIKNFSGSLRNTIDVRINPMIKDSMKTITQIIPQTK